MLYPLSYRGARRPVGVGAPGTIPARLPSGRARRLGLPCGG